MIFSLSLAACAEPQPERAAGPPFGSRGFTTYVKYLPLARNGDAQYQNLIGFMYFFGEGVQLDQQLAHFWFHLAAEQGYAPAERNLAIMHQLGLGAPRDAAEAARYARAAGIDNLPKLARSSVIAVASRSSHPAESNYAAFCAGCHGLNGVAAYINSPSFALGERMEKSDTALLHSLREGVGVMPGWGGKLSEPRLGELLHFVRGMEGQYQSGIGQALRRAPEQYFLFGPMTGNKAAYRGVSEE